MVDTMTHVWAGDVEVLKVQRELPLRLKSLHVQLVIWWTLRCSAVEARRVWHRSLQICSAHRGW